LKKGISTRERIMDIAEDAVLAKGFGATSIEEIIAAAGITKSGFFYHFKDKNALAQSLLERHLAQDDAILDGIFGRAGELSEDPLQVFLIGLKLLAEMMRDLPGGHRGCLVATYCYNERLFDRRIQDLNRQAVLNWRRRFAAMFARIDEIHGRPDGADAEALADMVSAMVEGGILLSKVLKEPEILARQILLLRACVQLIYQPRTQPRQQPRRSDLPRLEAGGEIVGRGADMLGK
jgi:TetR/AcrR family transcriptional repressor of nem operon